MTFIETSVRSNNHLYITPELFTGNNQIRVENVCHCIYNGCRDRHNSVGWMYIGVPLKHDPYVIAHRLNTSTSDNFEFFFKYILNFISVHTHISLGRENPVFFSACTIQFNSFNPPVNKRQTIRFHPRKRLRKIYSK